jgi:hypothetical protein
MSQWIRTRTVAAGSSSGGGGAADAGDTRVAHWRASIVDDGEIVAESSASAAVVVDYTASTVAMSMRVPFEWKTAAAVVPPRPTRASRFFATVADAVRRRVAPPPFSVSLRHDGHHFSTTRFDQRDAALRVTVEQWSNDVGGEIGAPTEFIVFGAVCGDDSNASPQTYLSIGRYLGQWTPIETRLHMNSAEYHAALRRLAERPSPTAAAAASMATTAARRVIV